MTLLKRQGLHYAWVVLLAACVLNVVSRADSASFGVFIDPLVEQFGWKRGDISFAYSLAFLAGLPAMVAMGWLGDRWGARTLMIGASLLIGTGTVLLGTIKELWHFYVFYGLFVGSLGNAAFTVLLPVIVTRWFHRHMGMAVGIYWAAMGAGPVIFAPLFRWLIETRGWSWSFTVIGIVVGGILVAFSWLIRSSPYEKGLSAYGAESSSRDPGASTAAAIAPTGLRQVLAKRPVWLLTGVHHLGCAAHAIILTQVVSMATFKGVSGVEAAGVLSTIAGTSIISRFASSVLTERLGGRAVLTMALIGQSTPVLILFFANDAWVFYLFAVIFGLCYGGEMVGFPIINRQLFGARAPLSSIYSFQMLGASTGMALGGWLGGALFDLTGGYNWAIFASAAIGYLGLPLALALPRHRSLVASGARAVAKA
ncbi:MAG: MFS transporter [Betaproteobacteria bacterium]|nr:MFS transporter [Betaproteobacteria bacterium]